MKLALIYGGKSQKIAETVKTIKDNLDIDCFKDIPEFIDTTIKRQIMYDRLLMPTTKLVLPSRRRKTVIVWLKQTVRSHTLPEAN